MDFTAHGYTPGIIVGGKLAFAELWDSIYRKKESESWQANPWVWVIEFERMEAK